MIRSLLSRKLLFISRALHEAVLLTSCSSLFFILQTGLSSAMSKFHDVSVYAGTKLATTASRLEIVGLLMESGATNLFLGRLLAGQGDCQHCKEATTLIFPEEDEDTLREAFRRLSFKTGSGLSIIKSRRHFL